jgi:hypothetical protein
MLAFALQQIQRDRAQHTERLRPLVFTNPAGSLIKGDIQDPMQLILNTPVLPHSLAKADAISGQ